MYIACAIYTIITLNLSRYLIIHAYADHSVKDLKMLKGDIDREKNK